MTACVEQRTTFINHTSYEASTSGAHLALIRSHTASLQQKQRKNPSVSGKVAAIDDGARRDLRSGQCSGKPWRLPHHRNVVRHEPRHIFPLGNTVRAQTKGLCQVCLLRQRSRQMSANPTPGSENGTLKANCTCGSVNELMTSVVRFGSRISPDSHRNDPFNSLPVPAGDEVNGFLDYYTQTFGPQYDWIYGGKGGTTPHTSLFLPMAVQSPCYFHSLMALCRMFCIMAVGGNPREDRLIMYHRGRAFQSLQESLGDVGNDAVLCAVISCVSADWVLGDFEAVATHSAGLTRLLTARARMPKSRIAPLFEAVLQTIPCTSAYHQELAAHPQTVSTMGEENPLEQNFIPFYPQHPFPAGICQTLSELPPGFSELCLTGRISRCTIMLMSGMNKLLPKGNECMRGTQWLAVFPWGGEDSRGAPMTTIDTLLLQGLLAFCLQNGFEPPSGHYSVSMVALRQRISSIDEGELRALAKNDSVHDALVWIHLCAVGVLSTPTDDISTLENHISLLDRVFQLFRNQKHLEWCNVSLMLHGFWFPTHLQKSWEACWTKRLSQWRSQV